MAMRFSNLLAQAGLSDAIRKGDAEVIDVVADSRRCRAGSCFVALRGNAADGHGFIEAAVAAGAAAVVCEDASSVPRGVVMIKIIYFINCTSGFHQKLLQKRLMKRNSKKCSKQKKECYNWSNFVQQKEIQLVGMKN